MESVVEYWEAVGDALRAALHWVEGFAATPEGPIALFVISFLESSVFPIPPDILLVALCVGDPSRSFWFATICSVASVLGGMAGYGIGYWGGRPLVKRFFDPERVAAVERLYDRYNAWATGIAGLTPLPYKLFTISGGAFAIRFRVFVLASVISRSARFFAEAALIWAFGPSVRAIMEEYLDILTVAFVILLVLGFWLVKRTARGAGDSSSERVEEGS